MLKILIAPTAYKGTLSPKTVAEAFAAGVHDSGVSAELVIAPLADGGDGTIEAIHTAIGGEIHQLTVCGPTGQNVSASWLKVCGIAFLELASACGIAHLAPDELSPLNAHTFGLGQMLYHCLKQGERDIVIALGGSASTDGGTGALRALGLRCLDADGSELSLGGGFLCRLSQLDFSSFIALPDGLQVRLATDVKNVLLGANGASQVFSPQKGATTEECQLLDTGLKRLADLLEEKNGRILRNCSGSGAAGGAAFGLASVLSGKIISGFQMVSELLVLKEKIKQSSLVITGEGRLDPQTLSGKAVGQLAQLCAQEAKPLWVFAASVVSDCNWQQHGISKVFTIKNNAGKAGKDDLRMTVCQAFRKLV